MFLFFPKIVLSVVCCQTEDPDPSIIFLEEEEEVVLDMGTKQFSDSCDIVMDILSRLPTDTVTQCKAVCRTWLHLIEDPYFIDMHSKNYIRHHHESNNSSAEEEEERRAFFALVPSIGRGMFAEYKDQGGGTGGSISSSSRFRATRFDFDVRGPRRIRSSSSSSASSRSSSLFPVRNYQHGWIYEQDKLDFLVGSSNGLICVHSDSYMIFQVFNPITMEHAFLPPLCYPEGRPYEACSFTYHHPTKEYKIVCISYTGRVQVYTLGSGRWRSGGTVTCMYALIRRQGIVWNGGIHWITYGMELVTVNLDDEEEVRVVSLPLSIPRHDPNRLPKLMVLGGCLCMVYCDLYTTHRMDIWELLNNDDDVNGVMNCTHKISIPAGYGSFDAPLALLRNGTYLLGNLHSIRIYDPKTASSTSICDVVIQSNLDCYIPYVPSFISPADLAEKDVVKAQGTLALNYIYKSTVVGKLMSELITEKKRKREAEVNVDDHQKQNKKQKLLSRRPQPLYPCAEESWRQFPWFWSTVVEMERRQATLTQPPA